MNKTRFLDFQKVEDKYGKFASKKENIISYHIPFSIIGDTGATFNLKVILKTLVPPDGFENHLIVIDKKIDGRGSSKYYYQCENEVKKILNYLSLPKTEVSFDKKNFVGVLEENKKYLPIFFERSNVSDKPDIIETSEDGKKRLFFKKQDKFYFTEADPIKDVSSGYSEELKRIVINNLSSGPSVFRNREDMESTIPQGMYKGYAPITFFAKEIVFKKYYGPGDMIVLNKEVKKKSYFGSNHVDGFEKANQFFYAFKDKIPEVEKFLKVYNEEIMGEKLEEFPPGSLVFVTNPVDRHKELENVSGVVLNKNEDKVQVKFLNYFTESFSPTELMKKEA